MEEIYVVKKGREKFVVELLRTADGKTFVTLHRNLKVVYKEDDEVKEWDIFEMKELKDKDEIEFDALPANIRGVISSALPY